jgi:hypothetical protein
MLFMPDISMVKYGEANPGSMDGLGLPSMALDTRFPAGMTSLLTF